MSATQYVFPDLPDPVPLHLGSGFYRITPERAGAILANNKTRNRPLTSVKVRRLIRDLKEGRWRLNGESVIFTNAGDVHDAHHRLTACRDSGVAITSLVAFGIEPQTFSTVDTGTGRSAADRRSLEGKKNANKLAALSRLVWQWDNGKPPTTAGANVLFYGPSEEELCGATFPEMEQIAAEEDAYYRRFPALAAAQWGFLIFITRRTCPDRSKEFLERLADGTGLAADSPVLLLRNRLTNTGRAKLPALDVMALCAKAWTAFAAGKPIRQLRWTPDEPFPSWGNDGRGKMQQGVLA